MSNSVHRIEKAVNICHLSTVHRRNDVRIFFKESVTLALIYGNVSLVVFDGQGNDQKAGVSIFDIGKPPKNRLFRMFAGFWKLLRNKIVNRADIIHFHDPELLLVGLLLRIRGKTVIYDAHEDVPRQIQNKHWIPVCLRGVIAELVELVENFVVRHINAVVAATPLICNRFRKVNQVTIVVRNYPLLGEFVTEPLDKPQSRNVCYVGALTRERGIIELLEALVELGDVRLMACGPFESKAFEAELRCHKGWGLVEYLGILDRRGVAEVMGKAQVGIVTLLPTSNQVEALPVKMFEYMASGTPVLASDFPLWSSIINSSGGGVVVNPCDPKKISKVLAEMLQSQEQLKGWGAAGRKAAIGCFNWERESVHLIDLYALIRTNSAQKIKK